MKKLTLRLAAVALGLAPLSANAFTVYDLVEGSGPYAIENLYWSKQDRYPDYAGNHYQYPGDPLGISKEVHFEYVRNINGEILPNYVKLVGFRGMTGSNSYIDKDFIFTIADANNNPTADGTRLILPNEIMWNKNNTVYESCVSTDGKYFLGALYNLSQASLDQYVDMVDYVPYYYQYAYKSGSSYYASYYQNRAQWVGEMTRKADGNILISFDEGALFYGTGFSGTSGYVYNYQSVQNVIANNQNPDKIIDKLTIETYRPTGTSTFKEYGYTYGNANYSTSGTQKTAKIRVESKTDGSFTILNPFGYGYARQMDNYSSFVPRLWTGCMKNGKIVLDGAQSVQVNHNNALGTYGARTGRYQTRLANLTGFPSRGVYTYDDVEGTIVNKPTIDHRTEGNSYWVSPGPCRTFAMSIEAEFDGKIAGVFNEMISGMDIYHSTPAWGDISMTIDELDVTLNADVVGGNLGWSKDELWPQINFEVYGNDSFVESYTLWMIPKSRCDKNPSSGHEDFTHENGHPLGFAVSTTPVEYALNSDYPKQYYLGRRFFKSELSEEQRDPEDFYYFYVQANYKGDIAFAPGKKAAPRAGGLTGTFHGFYGGAMPTAVTDLTMPGSDAVVAAADGMITVSNTEAHVSIYTADGRCIYDGEPAAVAAAHGIYVVRVGGTVHKVRL